MAHHAPETIDHGAVSHGWRTIAVPIHLKPCASEVKNCIPCGFVDGDQHFDRLYDESEGEHKASSIQMQKVTN